MSKFQRNPRIDRDFVDAFCWTGDQRQTEDPDWLGPVTFQNQGTPDVKMILPSPVRGGSPFQVADQGDWIVHFNSGEILVMEADHFLTHWSPTAERHLLDFTRLQQEVALWSAKNFGDQPSYRPLLGVQEEIGELAHAHLKAEQGIRGTAAEHLAAKKDAIGDLLIFLADYCGREMISLQECVETTWGEVKKRDWKKHPIEGVDQKPSCQACRERESRCDCEIYQKCPRCSPTMERFDPA